MATAPGIVEKLAPCVVFMISHCLETCKGVFFFFFGGGVANACEMFFC